MTQSFLDFLKLETAHLKETGLYKTEYAFSSPQQATIQLKDERKVLNFCANNYLGLANHPAIIKSAQLALESYGFGLASVRFICGTQTIHRQLEKKMSEFLGTEETILYTSCFDANGGLFETLFSAEDAIISDALNHASIIDGIRLAKAKRFRYANNDMADLEKKLQEAASARFRLIVTDGVFSMDGTLANLTEICRLADRYQAMVMVDDSHAVGFLGEKGQGTPAHCGVSQRIDIYTGTFGKALGGASGGYTSGRKEIIHWLRQRSRPYLFSNSLAPSIVAATLTAVELVKAEPERRQQLRDNSHYFRTKMEALGFELIKGTHPIVPLMLGEATLAQTFAAKMLERGIYVIGFFYPVVPLGKARIRIQLSASHTIPELDQALAAFAAVGRELKVI